MASGGRNRKSVASLKSAGTYRRDRHGATSAVVAGVPDVPEGLSLAARRHWDHIIGLMQDMFGCRPAGPLSN